MDIGIIGGADGPTQIFIAGSFGWFWWLTGGIVLLVALIAWFVCFRNGKQRR